MANWSKSNTGRPIGTDLADITVVADRIDNCEDGLNGDAALTSVDINGGAIDGVIIGANSAAAGTFTVMTASTIYSAGTISGTLATTQSFVIGSTVVVTGSAVFNADTDVNANITVVGSGDFASGLATQNGLDVSGTVQILGAWDASSYVSSTAYEALSDMIIVAYGTAATYTSRVITGFSDASNPPTTIVAKMAGDLGTATVTFPVRKGDYFQVDIFNFTSGVISAIPLGR